MKDLAQEVKELRADLLRHQNLLVKSKTQTETLFELSEAKDRLIEALKENIEEKNATIEALEKTIKVLEQ